MKNLLKQWRTFRRGKPGRRFQDRFDRNQRTIASQSWVQRLLQPAAAIVLLLIGVVLIFIPGPAFIFIFASAGLLAGESRALARASDWSEIKLRRIMRRLKHWWMQASTMAKQAVILGGSFGVVSAGYVAYRILLAR